MSKSKSIRANYSDARTTILSLLLEAGATGILSRDLIEVCQRAQARIVELRAEGYAIRSKRDPSGLTRYILTSANRELKPQLIAGFKIRVTDDGNVEVATYDGTGDVLSRRQQDEICSALRGIVAQKMSSYCAIDFAS